MFLRRLLERVRRQDWDAVLIELAMVVAGVFLGLQVSNWNDGRKAREVEATYLARIAEDVRSDAADMDEILRVSAVRMALLNDVLPKASGKPLPDGFESARGRVAIEAVPAYVEAGPGSAGFALFILTPLDGNRSAYETLINAGAIGGMHDVASLRRIQAYYASVDKVLHFEQGLEQNRDKLVDVQRRLGQSPAAPMGADDLAAAMAADPELLATAQNYWLYTNRHLKLVRELQAQARELARALDDEAGTRAR
jgi:hypothetical protein